MILLTCLPMFVRTMFRGLPGVWRSRHHLVLCWLIFMQAVFPGRKTLKELSFWSPSWITEWRLRRLLKAGYWSIHVLLLWFAQEAMKTLPVPEDRVIYVFGDGSQKDKRGKKNPVVQKGRKSQWHPWFLGIRFVIMMVGWDVYRIPFSFRLILPKTHPGYQTENALFREMVKQFTPPAWAKWVIVGGDTAYGSKENMKVVQKRDQQDPDRCWRFVFGIARTWKCEDGKSLKDLVTHLPRKFYRRTWIPKLAEERRRKTFWIFGKRMSLNHIGDVMVVLSKKGRNVGPKKTKLIVTNLIDVTPRQVIGIYQRRWSVELLIWELKSGLGLGQHQVTRKEDRVEKSIGIALVAYLFLLRVGRKDIRPGHGWSIFQLQQNLRLKVITHQVEHNMERKLKKSRKAA
jgi:hypothetical protein